MSEFRFPPLKLMNPSAHEVKVSLEQGTANSSGSRPSKVRLELADPSRDPSFANVDPALPGEFNSLQAPNDEKFKHPTLGIEYFGRWFLPLSKTDTTAPIPVNLPLVLIIPARQKISNDVDHLLYAGLANHLASHGFAVFCLNRQLKFFPNPDIGEMIEQTVQQLCFKSPNRVFLRDSIVLLGHSSGGGAVISNAGRVTAPKAASSKPRTLEAVILLATTAGMPDAHITGLGSKCKAMLGITVGTDTDLDTWGQKDQGLPMKSIFRVYDLIPTVEKDMIYVHNQGPYPPQPPDHYFENFFFVKAYVAAFLHRHLNGNSFYSVFLKHQVRPSTMDDHWVVVHQHQDRPSQSLLVADFDTVNPQIKTTAGILSAEVVSTFAVDGFSPHQTKALRIKWDHTTTSSPNNVELIPPQALSRTGFSYLSFRIGQAVSLLPIAFDVRVFLNKSAVLLSQVAGLIQPPIWIVFDPPDSRNLTKSIMRSFVIPLTQFAGLGSSITSVTFDFSINPSTSIAKSTFFLDSVQFWKV